MSLQSLKSDIPSSVVVFLVALPLCLGVALASGAPLISGIISGIIGGIVVGAFSQSSTSVSGPAAGLSAVVLASITELGVFEVFLTALVLSGVFQLIMGFLKAGFIADYIPSNVIKGLLAAIGVILILKQIPHAIGFDKDPEDDFTFFQADGDNTFSELLTAVNFITPGALFISVLSILILVFWDKTPLKNYKFFPASLFVVLLGVSLNFIFQNYIPYLAIVEANHLVNLPSIDTNNLGQYFHIPSIENLSNPKVWKVAFTIAAVSSLETLLNIEAVDKLDPQKRNSPPNAELLAQGIGNIASGFFGGIPVTSVIVRSSVNIQTGNATKLSAILHGIFMLISIFVLSPLLNFIPLASLAAILLFTGYKLARISLFQEYYRKGWQQFIPFVVTILAIVFTDLLIGVLIGLAVSIFFLLRTNFKNPFIKEKDRHNDNVTRLELSSQVSFLNKAVIKKTLWEMPPNSHVVIDASASEFIDNDVLEVIEDFRTVVAPANQVQLDIIGLKERYKLGNTVSV